MKCGVHVEVFLAGETSRTAGAREDWFIVGRRRRRRAGLRVCVLRGPEASQSVADRWNAERAVAGQLAQPISSAMLSLSDVSEPLIHVSRRRRREDVSDDVIAHL